CPCPRSGSAPAPAQRLALFVLAEELRAPDALPERGALVGQRLDAVEIGNQLGAAEGRAEPLAQRPRHHPDQRNDGLAPQRPVGLGVVGIGVVARQAEQHGGTPKASAISRAAVFLAARKSISWGESDMERQSSPPSSTMGRPALSAPEKAVSSSPLRRRYCSSLRLALEE